MQYKQFKKERISRLGMGCLRFPTIDGNPNQIDRQEAQKIIDTAMKAGINYYDTAYIYQEGDSETFLGEALAKYPRDSYYLATKFYEMSKEPIENVFETQLKRCNTEYFDFYLLHGLDDEYIDDYMDEEKGYLDYLLKQKKAGRIRYLGFSSHAEPKLLQRFLEWYDAFDMALIQLNYLDWKVMQAKEQYEILTEHGIPVWVMEPMKGGILSALNEEAAAILKAECPDRSVSSWGFRFLMSLPNVQTVLSGMSTIEQVQDNVQTFREEQPLSERELDVLRKAAAVYIKTMGVACSHCRYCCSSCPIGLDIPLLIAHYNEQKISGTRWRLTDIPKGKGPEACLQCGSCLNYCPQKIDIPGVLRAFEELLEQEREKERMQKEEEQV